MRRKSGEGIRDILKGPPGSEAAGALGRKNLKTVIYFPYEKRRDKMAVTVNIYYSGNNGNARKFADEMVSTGGVDKIRAEEGNLRYEYFFPMGDSETVLLIDSWKDQHSIDVHHASPMMAQIMELREKYDLHMKVERYVSDESGVPEKDMAFIKE